MHEALVAKRGMSFWKCWRSKFDTKIKHIMQVNGLINDSDIVNIISNHFVGKPAVSILRKEAMN